MERQINLRDVLGIAREAEELGFDLNDVALEMPDCERVRSLRLLLRGLGGPLVLVLSDGEPEAK